MHFVLFPHDDHNNTDFQNGMRFQTKTDPGKYHVHVTSSLFMILIFGPERDEVTGEWSRLHSKELCALSSSPNIIWVIKSERISLRGRDMWHVWRRDVQ